MAYITFILHLYYIAVLHFRLKFLVMRKMKEKEIRKERNRNMLIDEVGKPRSKKG